MSADYKVLSYKVRSRGSKNPRILFVGEAPGYHEDQQGKCFVGIAGNMLMDSIRKAGIPLSDCRFTNVVRCRPEDNKTPAFTYAIPCTAFLAEEILKTKPDVIVPLGNTALRILLNDPKVTIGSHIGTEISAEFSIGKYTLFPLWHPAFVCRDHGYIQDYIYTYTSASTGVTNAFIPSFSNNFFNFLTSAKSLSFVSSEQAIIRSAFTPGQM